MAYESGQQIFRRASVAKLLYRIAELEDQQSGGVYCMCNPNEAPYRVGSKLCAVCEKPRR